MGKLNKVATIEKVAHDAKIEGAKYNLQASRQRIIQTLYAANADRRISIHRDEILCITDWSSSTFDNRIKASAKPRHELYGARRELTEAEKRNRKGDRRTYSLYNLDEFDKWLKKEDPKKWKEVHALRRAMPAKLPSPAQTKTRAQAEADLWIAVFNKRGEIEALRGEASRKESELDDLLRAIHAGKTLGLVTLVDAMTKYQWASTKHREQVRKIWLRVLTTEQQRIDKYRELDRQQAIKTEQMDLEHTLPRARHSGRRPSRLGEQRI